jgi:hypothetical protein
MRCPGGELRLDPIDRGPASRFKSCATDNAVSPPTLGWVSLTRCEKSFVAEQSRKKEFGAT